MRARSTPAAPSAGELPPGHGTAGEDSAGEAPQEAPGAAAGRGPHGVSRGYLPAFDGSRRDAAAVRQVLSDVSVRAELAAIGLIADGDRRTVAMLAETARALHTILSDARPGVPLGGERLPAALVRVARMEQWLTTRAQDDPAAEPAADLCLWVLEHCEL
jgi:hypothetical protein